MAAVMIGVDPHKGSHTAVAIGIAGEPRAEVRVRACAVEAERLLALGSALAAADLGGGGCRRAGALAGPAAGRALIREGQDESAWALGANRDNVYFPRRPVGDIGGEAIWHEGQPIGRSRQIDGRIDACLRGCVNHQRTATCRLSGPLRYVDMTPIRGDRHVGSVAAEGIEGRDELMGGDLERFASIRKSGEEVGKRPIWRKGHSSTSDVCPEGKGHFVSRRVKDRGSAALDVEHPDKATIWRDRRGRGVLTKGQGDVRGDGSLLCVDDGHRASPVARARVIDGHVKLAPVRRNCSFQRPACGHADGDGICDGVRGGVDHAHDSTVLNVRHVGVTTIRCDDHAAWEDADSDRSDERITSRVDDSNSASGRI
jgi:hypothetical protein